MRGTTLRIERLDGDRLVIDAGPIALAFFQAPIVRRFEEVAGTTRRDAITSADLDRLNGIMGARSPRSLWEPLGRPRRWLQRIDPSYDLVTTPDRAWRELGADALIEQALTGCLGPGRNLGVATKMLHLKRPRLFPILDRLVLELLGQTIPTEAAAGSRARVATSLILHLREQARENMQALTTTHELLRERDIDVSLVRILDAVLWSCHPAAGGVATRGRVFSFSMPRASPRSRSQPRP